MWRGSVRILDIVHDGYAFESYGENGPLGNRESYDVVTVESVEIESARPWRLRIAINAARLPVGKSVELTCPRKLLIEGRFRKGDEAREPVFDPKILLQ